MAATGEIPGRRLFLRRRQGASRARVRPPGGRIPGRRWGRESYVTDRYPRRLYDSFAPDARKRIVVVRLKPAWMKIDIDRSPVRRAVSARTAPRPVRAGRNG